MSFVFSHIDKKIIEMVDELGYDGIRGFLFDKQLLYLKMLKSKESKEIDFNKEIDISEVSEHREKRIVEYVVHARKRIIELYDIENSLSKFGFSPSKTFNLFLLKNKINGV